MEQSVTAEPSNCTVQHIVARDLRRYVTGQIMLKAERNPRALIKGDV
jgi:hypothetical protein